jgi:hypothetical protein
MLATLALAALWLAGCKPAPPPEPETIGLEIFGLNYTDMPIGEFYINGIWGGNVTPYGAGLKIAGSTSLPAKWRPGIKVKVQWSDDRLYAEDKNALMTTEVEVPEYGKMYGGFLLVAFLPDRKIKVYASSFGPGHPEAPGGLMNPGEFCQAQEGCIAWYRSGQPPREGHY